MTTFLRPGQKAPAAFGVSFDTDKDAATASTVHYNPNERLALTEQRRRLPIFQHRDQILLLVDNHATTIIVGETGSGKTTQVPQYLIEAGWTSTGTCIAVTQPRRVAAMTVAARVAEERGCDLGGEVGYTIRFEDVSTPNVTKIKFCTDGVLLREMTQDPLLSRYSVVMVDEAHERSLSTDVLLGLLKKVQRRRLDLRVIVSSATLQARDVADFFTSSASSFTKHATAEQLPSLATLPPPASRVPALLSVEGRTHAVQVHYLSEPCADYVRAAVEAAVAIHDEQLPGDILIFLTGQDECETAVSWLREENHQRQASAAATSTTSRLLPVPLYAGLPAAAQLAAVAPPPRSTRKVVVATNIAETSLTIEGVVYVIDCMFAKQRSYNPLTGLESLVAVPISKASASQRAGRAGRVRPGHCFRLCTEESFTSSLAETEVPEMQRSDLAGVVLQLKHLGIDNMMTFHWLAPPPAETMVRALETLHALGALGDDARLTTPIGTGMADLPVEPMLSRALLAGAALGCACEVATIVAMLGVQSVWSTSGGDRRALAEAKSRFAVVQGDIATYLNVWQGWLVNGKRKRWAVENYVSFRAMLRAADVRAQLLAYLRRLGVPPASMSGMQGSAVRAGAPETEETLTKVQKALTAGLFLNAACLTDEISVNPANAEDSGVPVYRLVRTIPGTATESVRLRVHPSSVLFRCRAPWVCFVTAQQSDAGWFEMQDVMSIEPDWLVEAAPHYFSKLPVAARPPRRDPVVPDVDRRQEHRMVF